MKKNLLLLLSVFFLGALFLFPACSKDSDVSQLSISNYELRFTNTSENPYLVEINGTSSLLYGHKFKNYSLKKDTYAWQATQQAGYILYPTVKSGTITLSSDREIIIP